MTAPAIVLCGGRATRLAERWGDRPKALVPVAGRPFIEWQLEWLARGGVRRVHLAAGHLGSMLADWARRWSPSGPAATLAGALSWSVEPTPLGTGGGARFAAGHVDGDPVFVVNGDSLLPGLADFQSLENAIGRASKAWTPLRTADVSTDTAGVWAVMGVTQVADAARFGTVELDGEVVTGFLEKGRASSGWINGGVYLLRRAALEAIPAGQPSSLETDHFPLWAEDRRIAAVRVPPPLHDMGTPAGLAELERALGEG